MLCWGTEQGAAQLQLQYLYGNPTNTSVPMHSAFKCLMYWLKSCEIPIYLGVTGGHLEFEGQNGGHLEWRPNSYD